MDNMEIYARAYEEAQRLIEKCFSFFNPYSCEIDDEGIPFNQREAFYREVEDVLFEKGYNITRNGRYFKIDRYQAK